MLPHDFHLLIARFIALSLAFPLFTFQAAPLMIVFSLVNQEARQTVFMLTLWNHWFAFIFALFASSEYCFHLWKFLPLFWAHLFLIGALFEYFASAMTTPIYCLFLELAACSYSVSNQGTGKLKIKIMTYLFFPELKLFFHLVYLSHLLQILREEVVFLLHFNYYWNYFQNHDF